MPEEERRRLHRRVLNPEQEQLLEQLTAEVKAIRSARADDLRAICLTDPSEPFLRLVPILKQPSPFVSIGLARKIHSAVLATATKPTVGRVGTVKLTGNAVRSTRIVLAATLRALAAAGGKRKSAKGFRELANHCAETLARCCEIYERPMGWKEVLDFAREVASIMSVPLESFLPGENLANIYAQTEQGITQALSLALSDSNTVALGELAGLLRSHQSITDSVRQHLTSLISERAGTLPSESQAWVLRELGLGGPQPVLEYSDPADSPEVKQAAGLLMLMFDEQNASAVLKEAFDRFRSLCETHFHLFLRGTIGGVTEFDRRLHEPCDVTGGLVRLLRPWVEWYLPPNARIVIRGIVEPTKTSQEAL